MILTTYSKTPCGASWIHIAHLDSCFLSAPQPAEYSEAEAYCNNLDSSLVVINSEEEGSIVREFFARENPSFFNWIGIRWDHRQAKFKWVDNKERNYTYFLPDEPSITGECIAWVLDENLDGWQAISCHYSQFFMCQKKVEGIITTWHRDDEGVITSPGYPNNYENLEYDTHIIQSELGTRILMYFEKVETELNCDIITVSDDYGISGRTLFRLSGSYRNHSVISNRNHVMINFKTDEDGVRNGFSMRYKILRPLPTKVFSSNSYGTVTSNNYPSSPDSFLIQYYLIQCPLEFHVALTVKAIQLDRNDRVKLHNGIDEKASKIKIFRQFSPRSDLIKTTQNSMFISYDTGEQFNETNHWAFEYNCVPDGNLGDEIII